MSNEVRTRVWIRKGPKGWTAVCKIDGCHNIPFPKGVTWSEAIEKAAQHVKRHTKVGHRGHRGELPGMEIPTSVYIYFDAARTPIYVGMTSGLADREINHKVRSDWWGFVASRHVEHYPSRLDAELRERHLISTLEPRFNITHNPHALTQAT